VDDYELVVTEEDVNAHYKSPVSVAAGCSYRFDRGAIHTTVEWFDAVPQYAVLESSTIPEGPPAVTITRRLSQELRSVTNFGVGTEFFITEYWNGYASFATDFSAAPTNSTVGHSLSSWDLYHITAGAALAIGGLDVTLGVNHSFGSDDVKPPAESPVSGNGLESLLWNGTMKYKAWKIIVGFAFTV
jgi:hypothetical protein